LRLLRRLVCSIGNTSPNSNVQYGRLVAVKAEPEPSADPAVTAAQAQIEIATQAAAADAEIKHESGRRYRDFSMEGPAMG
jgi:hypothetical protein